MTKKKKRWELTPIYSKTLRFPTKKKCLLGYELLIRRRCPSYCTGRDGQVFFISRLDPNKSKGWGQWVSYESFANKEDAINARPTRQELVNHISEESMSEQKKNTRIRAKSKRIAKMEARIRQLKESLSNFGNINEPLSDAVTRAKKGILSSKLIDTMLSVEDGLTIETVNLLLDIAGESPAFEQ